MQMRCMFMRRSLGLADGDSGGYEEASAECERDGGRDEVVLLDTDARHPVDLLAEEVGGGGLRQVAVDFAEALYVFVAGDVDPGDWRRLSAAAYARLDGPRTEERGSDKTGQAKDEEDGADVALH